MEELDNDTVQKIILRGGGWDTKLLKTAIASIIRLDLSDTDQSKQKTHEGLYIVLLAKLYKCKYSLVFQEQRIASIYINITVLTASLQSDRRII